MCLRIGRNFRSSLDVGIFHKLRIAMLRTFTDHTSGCGACGRTRDFWSRFLSAGPKDSSRIDYDSQVPMKANNHYFSLNVSSLGVHTVH